MVASRKSDGSKGRHNSLTLVACGLLSFGPVLPACLLNFPENDGMEALALLPAAAGASSDSSVAVVDVTPPVFAGAASVTALSTSRIQVNWNQATDDVSSATNIQYRVCASTSSTGCITSFSSSYTTTGSLTLNATGLTGDTVYYFVVRATDEAGNSDSNTLQFSTSTSYIKIWAGPARNGSFTRTDVDADCTGTIPSVCDSAAALLSFSAADEVQDTPTNFGVPTGVRIANPGDTNTLGANWAAILGGGISQPLENNGVMNNNEKYWTGSTGTGALTTNCNGWTDNSGGQNGVVGAAERNNARWISDTTGGGVPLACNGNRRFLCICW